MHKGGGKRASYHGKRTNCEGAKGDCKKRGEGVRGNIKGGLAPRTRKCRQMMDGAGQESHEGENMKGQVWVKGRQKIVWRWRGNKTRKVDTQKKR